MANTHGITNNHRFTDEQKLAIAKDYESGVSSSVLSAKYGFSVSCILRMLHNLGVRIKSLSEASRRYTLNEGAFEDSSSEEAHYWIGFLMGDGNLHIRSPKISYVVRLSLSIKDIGHVKKFAEFVKTDMPIRIGPRRGFANSSESATITLVSKRLFESLIVYGLTQRKSLTANVIGLEGSPSFWRGYVDANGCLMCKRNDSRGKHDYPLINLSGSHDILTQFVTFCISIDPTCVMPINFNGRSRVNFQCATTGTKAQAIVKSLYGSNGPSLDRKREIAECIAAWIPKRRLVKC